MLIKLENVTAVDYHKLLGALLSEANHYPWGRDGKPTPIVVLKEVKTGDAFVPGEQLDHHVTLEVPLHYNPGDAPAKPVPLSVLAHIFSAMEIFPADTTER